MDLLFRFNFEKRICDLVDSGYYLELDVESKCPVSCPETIELHVDITPLA